MIWHRHMAWSFYVQFVFFLFINIGRFVGHNCSNFLFKNTRLWKEQMYLWFKKVDIELVSRTRFWNNLHMDDHNQKIGEPNMLKISLRKQTRGHKQDSQKSTMVSYAKEECFGMVPYPRSKGYQMPIQLGRSNILEHDLWLYWERATLYQYCRLYLLSFYRVEKGENKFTLYLPSIREVMLLFTTIRNEMF